MTIDEVIAHSREVAKEQRKDYDNCEYKSEYGCGGCADYYSKPCIECAEEYEQLAEWLEDYKRIKMLIPIEQALKAEYNKAIDDFVKALRIEYAPVSDEMQKEYDNVCSRFEKIAEQLKAGRENE